MQGKQNISNSERKGPHKSMHCKFCKPPGVVTPEKSSQGQLETKTKVHLAHEGADLRLCNTYNEPGYPNVETEACTCKLEGENSCPKCVPDKNRPPIKKKVCNCPKGAKPDMSKYNEKAPEKKETFSKDEEFWWEKYSREHDALAKETWAAYMAQRRKTKKLEKCQKQEESKQLKEFGRSPSWFQSLSCQQIIYVEYLSTAIRLDSDENVTHRTDFVLGGIGLYPRPKRNVLKKCLRFCHYNAIQFLNQLYILLKEEDPFHEKLKMKNGTFTFSWNEKLVMNALCHLEFPYFLRELMDRLPQLYREPLRPQIPYPVFPKPTKKTYCSPYEEPIWQDRLNWLEKMKIDKLNRCRIHMDTKRVKIPPLALVRRPSLIDARPPFLAQIEANERASRRLTKEKKMRHLRKHPISTFNSSVDVTAIAGIEASEISTTDKADTEDICVFLREPKEPESTEGEVEEEPECMSNKEVKFIEEPPKLEETQMNYLKCFTYDSEEYSEEGEKDSEEEYLEFKTPPKTESGKTIQSPCPPPSSTPGPPATHFDKGKRELDIINEEICEFFPFVSSNEQIVNEEADRRKSVVELNLISVAEKLKQFAQEEEDASSPKKYPEKLKKKDKNSKKCKKSKKKRISKSSKKKILPKAEPDEVQPELVEMKEEGEGANEVQESIVIKTEVDEDLETKISFKKEEKNEKERKSSEESDPDPDAEDEWTSRPPCTSDTTKLSKSEKSKLKKKHKRRKGKRAKRKQQKSKTKQTKKHKKRKISKKEKRSPIKITEEEGKLEVMSEEKTEATDIEETEDDFTKEEHNEEKKKEDKKEAEENKRKFRGDVMPLVKAIVKDLAEEGFYCATYPRITNHPDINQLILHLKGVIVTQKLKNKVFEMTKYAWSTEAGVKRFPIETLGLSNKQMKFANWNDKKWISKLARWKKNCFYYKVAKNGAAYASEIYGSLNRAYYSGTERYLKIFYAYMPSKYKDCLFN